MDKKEILSKFSADPERYYKVKLFDDERFERKSCATCKRFYWTIDENRVNCPDHSDDTYSFIGNPPTTKRFDYTQAWKEVESFFVKNGHTSVNRYPVVCRWRDDLYFTIASIVDFQRVMGSKVVFEFPANPLVVPQTCLRFKDLENVGVTGRHFSSFCMIGQHSIPNSHGYWKDECVDLDYRLVTEQFGVDKKEVVFVEDVWEGGGSFGSSLEFFVKGLELGNAVFTEFQGDLSNYKTLDQQIIDMGAGLERFAWLTMGTPTAYDCCFGPITNNLLQQAGIDTNDELLVTYFTKIAKHFERFSDLSEVRKNAIKSAGLSDEQVNKIIIPLEGIYLIVDHIRTLIFAISDGALPSNVGGGYNLRMMLRRIISTMDRLSLKLDMNGIVDAQIDYLKNTYPELEKTREDIKTIIGIESGRYENSKLRMEKIVSKLNQKPTVDDLIRLYESDGVTPDYLKEMKVISDIPSTFYSKLSELHQSKKQKEQDQLSLAGLPGTELLYYGDDPKEFDAKVLKSFDKYVVLDKTSFYARGGGQEPDHGTIENFEVVDVSKHGNVIVHELKNGIPKEGSTVSCVINSKRRDDITKNHTSTHILNSSSRSVLGSWVWQHSAFKEEDHARLDITHHSALTDDEITKIEDLANSVVEKNIPVTIENFDRGTAEQKYGFKIYQGGIVPVKSIRIVSIEDFDIEACGGTHVKQTDEIELIKITRTKRIQDGVVRIEFVSGDTALDYVKRHDADLIKKSSELKDKTELKEKRREQKQELREKFPLLVESIIQSKIGSAIVDEIVVDITESGKPNFCCTDSDQYDEFFHIGLGEKLIEKDPWMVYCGVFEDGDKIRAIIYSGDQAGKDKKAGDIAKIVSEILGGAGGGTQRFAQGGGKDKSKKNDAIEKVKSMVLGV
ncbi:alanine--tRNA ligase [Marine Group I thaumarchaeote]|uniref:Alanine--tRNA ligase n=1 Tax=Marine Group I thaumarchaeote TaxID=2511932 RepID=A0A7K4NRP5_9ARCH|nr:alanine--tRNA ligase [Marine Group I thaumarchaeote]